MFDGDGGGTIDSNEINTMMVGLFEMAGAKVTEEQLAVRIGFLFSASDVMFNKVFRPNPKSLILIKNSPIEYTYMKYARDFEIISCNLLCYHSN